MKFRDFYVAGTFCLALYFESFLDMLHDVYVADNSLLNSQFRNLISGESYGGVYVPQLVNALLKRVSFNEKSTYLRLLAFSGYDFRVLQRTISDRIG